MASTPSEPTAKPENEEIIAYRRETICPSIIPRLPSAVCWGWRIHPCFFSSWSLYSSENGSRRPTGRLPLVPGVADSRRRDWAGVFVWRDGLDVWTRAGKVPEIVSRIVVPPLPQATASSRNQQLALSKRFKVLVDDNALVMLGVIIGTALVLAWTMLLIR
jgi:hypothetical protein